MRTHVAALAFFCMALSRSNCADWTASEVSFGCAERDFKKFLSWIFGRNGSTGHDEAILDSFCVALEATMAVLLRSRVDEDN